MQPISVSCSKVKVRKTFFFKLVVIVFSSKREVPRGVRNSKDRRQVKFRGDWSRH